MDKILTYYNAHKEQLVIAYLAIQAVAKAIQDGIKANEGKKGASLIFGVILSVIGYLGIGKRA